MRYFFKLDLHMNTLKCLAPYIMPTDISDKKISLPSVVEDVYL